MLAEMASWCRAAMAVFETDPTLADEPYETGQLRSIDLLVDLIGGLSRLLLSATGSFGLDRWPRADRWEEAEAMYEHTESLAAAVLTVVPRPEHHTPAGSRTISRHRLAANHGSLLDAAATIRSAVAAALRLPHPDPHAVALAELADQLQRDATDLETIHTAHRESLDLAVRTQRAAAQPQ